ncbi:MAG: hypothetical protein IKS35_05250 [Clostridia bacterium]|nr:hypothetical protein [Clostridia bacterium]
MRTRKVSQNPQNLAFFGILPTFLESGQKECEKAKKQAGTTKNFFDRISADGARFRRNKKAQGADAESCALNFGRRK